MKKLIITVASLLIMVEHMAGAGVVVVSDPGQHFSGQLMALGDTAPFIHIGLTASNTSDQTVYLTIQQSGAASDIDLFAGSVSNKLTGMQVVLGSFVVQSGLTNDVVISARVNSVKATNSSPVTIRLDLTAVSNSTPSVIIQGILPIQGTSYLVDTNSDELVKGKFTSIGLTYNVDEEVAYYLIIITGKAHPLRVYTLEHSTNMVDWEEWLFVPVSGLTGYFQIGLFLDPVGFPNLGFFRLKSQ